MKIKENNKDEFEAEYFFPNRGVDVELFYRKKRISSTYNIKNIGIYILKSDPNVVYIFLRTELNSTTINLRKGFKVNIELDNEN